MTIEGISGVGGSPGVSAAKMLELDGPGLGAVDTTKVQQPQDADTAALRFQSVFNEVRSAANVSPLKGGAEGVPAALLEFLGGMDAKTSSWKDMLVQQLSDTPAMLPPMESGATAETLRAMSDPAKSTEAFQHALEKMEHDTLKMNQWTLQKMTEGNATYMLAELMLADTKLVSSLAQTAVTSAKETLRSSQ